VLALRWPAAYSMERAPARSADEWEEIRVRFLAAAKSRVAQRTTR
jgi:hypothetical protein